MEWSFFFRQLEVGMSIDETCFYFSDDPTEEEHYLGNLPEYEKPYWVGYCDVEGGCEFKTASELVNAPIYNGKSLKSRWDKVVIVSIERVFLWTTGYSVSIMRKTGSRENFRDYYEDTE